MANETLHTSRADLLVAACLPGAAMLDLWGAVPSLEALTESLTL